MTLEGGEYGMMAGVAGLQVLRDSRCCGIAGVACFVDSTFLKPLQVCTWDVVVEASQVSLAC